MVTLAPDPTETEAFRTRHQTLQAQLARTTEREIRNLVKRGLETDPEFKSLTQKAIRLNDKIHRNHMRQSKQKTSFDVHVRKARKARKTRKALIVADQTLLERRKQLNERMEAIKVAKRQEAERVVRQATGGQVFEPGAVAV